MFTYMSPTLIAYCPGLYAPGVTPHWLPPARNTLVYRPALDTLIAEHSIDVLIPTSDYDVEGVVSYLRDGWAPKVAMFHPGFESFYVLSDKGRLAAHLSKRLLAVVPMTWTDERPGNTGNACRGQTDRRKRRQGRVDCA